MTESGGGVFWANSAFKTCPITLYAIYKHESAYDQTHPTNYFGTSQPLYPWQIPLSNGRVYNPSLDIGTFGALIEPRLRPWCKLSLEAAYQVGGRNETLVSAFGTEDYLIVDHILPDESSLKIGVTYFSGSDMHSATDSGFNPLWSRSTQRSELYALAYPGFRWSNLLMPKTEFSYNPRFGANSHYERDEDTLLSSMSFTGGVSYLMAPVADGPGAGGSRGWLYQAHVSFPLGKDQLRYRDRLTSHLWLECLQPGDYYLASQRKVAFFARWEIKYTF